MDAADPTPYVARSPDDLIALVPYLLGFHPEESLVLLTFGSPDGSFHARLDLPGSAAERREVVEVLLHAVRVNAVPRVAVVVFSGDDRARAVVEELAGALDDAGVVLVDAVRADGSAWWSMVAGDREHGHPYDLSTHRFTADRVFEGQVALASRDDVASGIRHPRTPATDHDTAEIARSADRWVQCLVRDSGRPARLREHASWLAQVLAAGDPLPPAEAARVLVLVGTSGLRDVACLGLTRTSAARHVERWRELLRRAPDDLVPGAAAVLALAAWVQGDGALAWCAIERCQEAQRELAERTGRPAPSITLVDRVADLLLNAVSPATWQPLQPSDLPLLATDPLDEAS